MKKTRTVETWPDLLAGLALNETPLVFSAATPALLAGIEHWIGRFERVSLTNSFDGIGEQTFLDTGVTPQDFASYSDCINYILETGVFSPKKVLPEGARCMVPLAHGADQALAEQSGFMLVHASPVVIDDTKAIDILKQAKVPHSMILLGAFADYAAFRQACAPAGLRLSVDVSVADEVAGRLPVEISSQEDWDHFSEHLSGRSLVARKPYGGRRYAVEMVVTSNGSLCAPLTEVKFERFWHTHNWLALSVSAARHVDTQAAMQPRLRKIGAALADVGFRGAVSVEFIEDNGSLVVDRLLPNLTQNSLLAHVVTSLHGGFPIHLLHLQACLDVSHQLTADKIQARYALHDDWSVIALRHSGSQTEMITRAPASGLYRRGDGSIECIRRDCDWRAAIGKDGYFLRFQNAGNYRAPGTLLGLLYLRQQVLTQSGELTPNAADWIAALQVEYAGLAISGSSLPAAMTTPRREDYL